MQKPQKTAAHDTAVSGKEQSPPEMPIVTPDKKQRRTTGLWLFDAFLYPFLNNIVVFAVSVVATYLTSHGDRMGGAMGRWFHRRGESFIKLAMKTGMNEKQADEAKMVFFSFLDGSIMAPFIKILEDRRERIARGIDVMLGTVPKDESVYAAEPKQTWGSVLLGRAATSAIVVPTAVALDKLGWNDRLFHNPGLKMGKAFKENFPKYVNKHPHIDFPGLFKVGVFEAFYTTVCTIGLYISSRFLARQQEHYRERHPPKAGRPGKSESFNAAMAERAAELPRPERYMKEETPEAPAETSHAARHARSANNVDYVTRRRHAAEETLQPV